MAEFRMPSLGADMDEGTVVEWRIAPGDQVRRGDIVAVVDTAKAAIEIESFEDATVLEVLVTPGTRVPVGTVLAQFGPPGSVATPPATPVLAPAGVAVPVPPVPAAAPGRVATPRATPPVRHLAAQLGVDLATVIGTGRGGCLTHDDISRAASRQPREQPAAQPLDVPRLSPERPDDSSPPPEPLAARAPGPAATRVRVTPRARRMAARGGLDPSDLGGSGGVVTGADVAAALDRARPPTPAGIAAEQPAVVGPAAQRTAAERTAAQRTGSMRRAIASLMSRSAAEIPHYYVTRTLEISGPLAWLREHNAALPARSRVLPAALFLRATVRAALAVPDLNGHWIEGTLVRANHVDLAVAVATRGGGLVTPTLPGVEALGLDALMERLADLVGRARRGSLRQSEMATGTITVSSLGEGGPDALYGVIFPPQVALVGVGGIVERAWAEHGMLAARPTVTITLAADHRASDGRTAAAFLGAFAAALAEPERL